MQRAPFRIRCCAYECGPKSLDGFFRDLSFHAGMAAGYDGNEEKSFVHGGDRFYTGSIPPECTDRQGSFFSGYLEKPRSCLGLDDGHLQFHPARFSGCRAKNGEILRVIAGNVYICSPFRGFPAGPGIDGAVAQSVEQWTENPCVGGSIPPHTTGSPGKNAGAFYL